MKSQDQINEERKQEIYEYIKDTKNLKIKNKIFSYLLYGILFFIIAVLLYV